MNYLNSRSWSFRPQRVNGPTAPNQPHSGRVTRSQTTTERDLLNARRQIRELNQSKQNADNLISRLRTHQQGFESVLQKLKSDKALLLNEYKQLDSYCDDVEKDLEFVLNNIVMPYAESRNLAFVDVTDKSIAQVLEPMLQDALQAKPLRNQNQGLRNQVQGLQREMLARVEKIRVVTDDQFAQDFRSLASSIKSLSRVVRVSDQMDTHGVFGSLILLKDVSPHYWKSRAQKKNLIEGWIWSILISLVFQNPFRLFGEDIKPVHQAWSQIFGAEHSHGWPLPSLQSETWRYKTAEQLTKLAGEDNILHGTGDPIPKDLSASVATNRIIVASVLEQHFDIPSSGNDNPQVRQIVDKTFQLALQLSLQRSRLQLTYPSVGDHFNHAQMSAIPGPDYENDDDDMCAGAVAFVVYPGLAKWGDARGENFDHRYDIVSSLVQLEYARMEHHPEAEFHNHKSGHSIPNGQPNDDQEDTMPIDHDMNGDPHIKREPIAEQELEWV